MPQGLLLDSDARRLVREWRQRKDAFGDEESSSDWCYLAQLSLWRGAYALVPPRPVAVDDTHSELLWSRLQLAMHGRLQCIPENGSITNEASLIQWVALSNAMPTNRPSIEQLQGYTRGLSTPELRAQLDLQIAQRLPELETGRRPLLSLLKRYTGAPLMNGALLTCLGRWHVEAHHYDTARRFHHRAIECHKSTGALPQLTASLGGLALCELGNNRPAQSLPYLNQAIRRCEQMGSPMAAAAWHHHLQHALALLGREELQIEHLRRFAPLVESLGNLPWAAALWRQLSSLSMDCRKWEIARNALLKALAITPPESPEASELRQALEALP